MKILLCTGLSDENFRSGHVVIRTLQRLGHKVYICGPVYGDFDCKETIADIPVPDRRSFPEFYDYDVVKRCPERPDLILQMESHFWFKGPNKTGIPSAVWIMDIHRGGKPFRDLIVQGQFNYVFLSFKYYAPLFTSQGLKPIWLPMGVDEDIVSGKNVKQECDIAMLCETGLNPRLLNYNQKDNEGYSYCTDIQDRFTIEDRLNGTMYMSKYEYQARAELIYRLMQDFDIRVYNKVFNKDYIHVLSKGRLTFNRTSYFDTSHKMFELCASERMLITNNVPHLEELLPFNLIDVYDSYYDPRLPHLFDLDYEQVKYKVEYWLKNEKERIERSKKGKEYVMSRHTMRHRVERMLNWIGKPTHGESEYTSL